MEAKVLTKYWRINISQKMRDLVVHTGMVDLYLEGNGRPWKILFQTLTELRYRLWAVWT